MNQTSAPALNLSLVVEYGKVRSFDELPDNAVALDGAVSGPAIDGDGRRRYSFDHHGHCLRLVTLATCQQVFLALRLGLVIDERTVVYANDVDADTTLAAWLLERAGLRGEAAILSDARVAALVERIGLTDAHGPVFAPHPIHAHLGPSWNDKRPQTVDMLREYMRVLDRWYDEGIEPAARPDRPAKGWAIRATGGWEPVESPDGFGDLYKRGYLAAALVTDAADDTRAWTVGKRSDLVPLAVGPADRDPTRKAGDYDDATILGALAARERALFSVDPSVNWGGGSCIGGSPRYPSPSGESCGSKLRDEDVVAILQTFRVG